MLRPHLIELGSEVKEALSIGAPVVALESTIITHGLPQPVNIETALKAEDQVRAHGATPATIAIIDGQLRALPGHQQVRRQRGRTCSIQSRL